MTIRYLAAPGALLLAAFLLAPASATADVSYTYLELDYVNVDTDLSERVADTDVDARLKTDDDGGFRLGGSWNFYDNWHVFGEYQQAENDIDIDGTVTGTPINASGDFDVTRWRLGAGYAYPLKPELSLYGRLSYDYIEFDDVDVTGVDDLDTDDDGLGAEAGVRWFAATPFELQGYVRYTSVGDVETDDEDEFDNDVLVGVSARYYFKDMYGIQAGYEIGEINTFNIGARVQFK